MKNFSGFDFWLLWSLWEQHPAHEASFFAVGKTDISSLISESIWIVTNGSLQNLGMVCI